MSFLDRSRDLFDGHLRVQPVLIEQLDGFEAQPLQASLGSLPDSFGAAVKPGHLPALVVEAELGGDHHLVPHRGERFPRQFLIDEWPVSLGGIEQGDAPLHGLAGQLDHRLPIRVWAAMVVHPHAPEAEGRYFQRVLSRTERAAMGDQRSGGTAPTEEGCRCGHRRPR
jgi:hypothetical protein